jgi:hypothetical protein
MIVLKISKADETKQYCLEKDLQTGDKIIKKAQVWRVDTWG